MGGPARPLRRHLCRAWRFGYRVVCRAETTTWVTGSWSSADTPSGGCSKGGSPLSRFVRQSSPGRSSRDSQRTSLCRARSCWVLLVKCPSTWSSAKTPPGARVWSSQSKFLRQACGILPSRPGEAPEVRHLQDRRHPPRRRDRDAPAQRGHRHHKGCARLDLRQLRGILPVGACGQRCALARRRCRRARHRGRDPTIRGLRGSGTPGRIRTYGLLLRRQALYPD